MVWIQKFEEIESWRQAYVWSTGSPDPYECQSCSFWCKTSLNEVYDDLKCLWKTFWCSLLLMFDDFLCSLLCCSKNFSLLMLRHTMMWTVKTYLLLYVLCCLMVYEWLHIMLIIPIAIPSSFYIYMSMIYGYMVCIHINFLYLTHYLAWNKIIPW
jgi:hypothetical protein